jgi:hypothetical protein
LLNIVHPAVFGGIHKKGEQQSPILVNGKCTSCETHVARLTFDAAAALQLRNKERAAANKVTDDDDDTAGASGEQANNPMVFTGRLLIIGRNRGGGGGKYRLLVPFTARIYIGQLVHEPAETAFHIDRPPPLIRNITLRNTFAQPIAVHNITLSRQARKYLQV